MSLPVRKDSQRSGRTVSPPERKSSRQFGLKTQITELVPRPESGSQKNKALQHCHGNDQSAEIDHLNEELKLAQEDRDYFKEELKQAAFQLNKFQANNKNKVADDYFVSAWQGLRYEIKNWAFRHFGTEREAQPLLNAPPELHRHVVRPEMYLQSGRLRPLLVQSALWKGLEDCVFRYGGNRGLCWAGERHASLRGLFNALEPEEMGLATPRAEAIEVVEYQKWRASTAALMASSVASNERIIQEEAVIQRLVLMLCSIGNAKGEGFLSGLSSIVSNAVQLDVDLQRQRAVWRPFRAHLGYVPEQHLAEIHGNVRELGEEDAVKLVISPGLIKCGTSDGEMYSEAAVLVKCQVLVDDIDSDIDAVARYVKTVVASPVCSEMKRRHLWAFRKRRVPSTRELLLYGGDLESIQDIRDRVANVKPPSKAVQWWYR